MFYFHPQKKRRRHAGCWQSIWFSKRIDSQTMISPKNIYIYCNIEVFSDRRQERFEVFFKPLLFFFFFWVFVFCAFPIVQDRTTWDSWQKGLDVPFQPSGDQFHPTVFFCLVLGNHGSFIPITRGSFPVPEKFSKKFGPAGCAMPTFEEPDVGSLADSNSTLPWQWQHGRALASLRGALAWVTGGGVVAPPLTSEN